MANRLSWLRQPPSALADTALEPEPGTDSPSLRLGMTSVPFLFKITFERCCDRKPCNLRLGPAEILHPCVHLINTAPAWCRALMVLTVGTAEFENLLLSCCVLLRNGRGSAVIRGARKEWYLPKEVFGVDYMLPTKACYNRQTKIIIFIVYA